MKYRNVIAGLVGAWFILSLAASARGVFENASNSLALPVAAAALAPIVLFFGWFAASPGFREFLLALNPRTLTLAHTWRVNGFIFLVLSAYGALPRLFALPAGLGDMAIGITAPWIAAKFASPEHKGGFVFWQILGIVDLVSAVTLGTTARLIDPTGPGMGPMTVLPLSLIPTFFVPLLLILHVICIAQARRWPASSYSRMGGSEQVSAFGQR
jgi:uncharacterized membrane protein YeaQ/YmgE (transglycosylase-associated protein family)